jgi:hypothetical protein
MEQKVKKIIVNGVPIPALIKNRALVDYKRDTGRTTVLDVEDALRLSWHGLRAGAKSVGLEFKMSFEDWIDYTDAHPEIENDLKEEEAEATEEDKKKFTT